MFEILLQFRGGELGGLEAEPLIDRKGLEEVRCETQTRNTNREEIKSRDQKG